VLPTLFFGKIGRIASEEVILEITRCKYIPILLYGTEAFMLNKSELSSLDFVINRLFTKLFRTNNIETVDFFQDQFGFDKPGVLWARCERNFDSKFVASENAFCKLTLSLKSTL